MFYGLGSHDTVVLCRLCFLLVPTAFSAPPQVHYDNPAGIEGAVDHSSVRIFYSDTPRQYDAGTLTIGDALIHLQDQPVEGNRNYTFTCPSECTSQMVQPSVTVFASMLHAHLTGLQLWTNLYRNGTFERTIEAARFWSNEHQRNTLLNDTVTLLPGDELRMSCLYDVAKVNATDGAAPVFGLATDEEMCMSFLFVYPRPTKAVVPPATVTPRLGYCAPVYTDEDGTVGTFCGDFTNFTAPGSVLPFDAAARADTGGLVEVFGGGPTCSAVAT